MNITHPKYHYILIMVYKNIYILFQKKCIGSDFQNENQDPMQIKIVNDITWRIGFQENFGVFGCLFFPK